MRTLKMRNKVAGHQKLTTSWGQSLKLIFLQLHEKLPKNSVSTILWLVGIWSKIGKMKELGASWADRTSKKSSFWSGVFSYSTQQIVSQLDCDMSQKVTFIWQLVMTSSVVGPRRSSEALPKAKLAPKKVMVTIWQSPDCLIYYSFLNPNETITSEKYVQQIDEMHWNLQHLWPAHLSKKGPILHRNSWLHST